VFKPVGSLLQEVPLRAKTPKAIFALQIRLTAKESLKIICSDLPKEIVDTIKPSVFKNGILTITAPQMVTSELQMRSEGLIKEINKSLGRKIVERLRFKVA